MNIDRYNDDTILSLVEQPPLMDTLTTNWLTLPQLLATPTLLAAPAGGHGVRRTSSRPSSTTGASACSGRCRGS